MSGPEKRAREMEEAVAAGGARSARATRRAAAAAAFTAAEGGAGSASGAGGAGDAAAPGAHVTPTLLDVAWIVAKRGYAADVWRCCGTCRELWRWIAPELSEEDAARVRRDHPFWQAIINLPHGKYSQMRLMLAVERGELSSAEELIAWHANVDAASKYGVTALMYASERGNVEVVRALLAAGASVDAATNAGYTSLIFASYWSYVEIVRTLLAAGADKHLATLGGDTAYSVAAHTPGSTAAIHALLDLAS